MLRSGDSYRIEVVVSGVAHDALDHELMPVVLEWRRWELLRREVARSDADGLFVMEVTKLGDDVVGGVALDVSEHVQAVNHGATLAHFIGDWSLIDVQVDVTYLRKDARLGVGRCDAYVKAVAQRIQLRVDVVAKLPRLRINRGHIWRRSQS